MYLSPDIFSLPDKTLSRSPTLAPKEAMVGNRNIPQANLGKRKRAAEASCIQRHRPLGPGEHVSADSFFAVGPKATSEYIFPPPTPSLGSSRRSQTLPAGSTATHAHHFTYEDQPLPKICRRTNSPKYRPSGLSPTLPTTATVKAIPSKVPSHSPLLKPCHLCHKGPTQKKDLDSYGDCSRCVQRTCYICMRQCTAGGCGNSKVCSSCCIEQGEEGDACCLDCLSRGQGFDMDIVGGFQGRHEV